MHTPKAAKAYDLRNVETPVLVLDQQRMDGNIRRMRDQLARLGVAFRPHVKTSKSIDVVRRTIGAETGPITVSTLKEAEYFAGFGFTDILYAVGIAPNKLQHVARSARPRRGADCHPGQRRDGRDARRLCHGAQRLAGCHDRNRLRRTPFRRSARVR